MLDRREYTVFKFRRKSWYVWILRFTWLAWLVLWLEVAIGSGLEMEARAGAIAKGIFLGSLVLGLVIWFVGRRNDSRRR